MSSRLIVLGSCGGWPEAGRACSGFVLEHDGVRIVLDLGYGTFPRLSALLESSHDRAVDAVIVTHAHPDHLVDVHALMRARWFGLRGAPRLPLYAAPGVVQMLTALEDGDSRVLHEVFDVQPLAGRSHQVGPLLLEAWALPHYVPNVGVRLSAPGLVVAYTGDTGPHAALAELGRNADLFIVEATDRHQRPGVPRASEPDLDLTAEQAGAAAQAAGAHRLLLTHFWPGNDREASAAAADHLFSGEVLIAQEGQQILLP